MIKFKWLVHAINRCVLLLLVLISLSGTVAAAKAGRLTGRVTDAVSGQPLPGANVVLVNSVLGASTDDDGRFVIDNVPPGNWKIRVAFIGYTAQERVIAVGEGPLSVDFALKPSAILFDQVVITGSRHAEDLSDAPNSVNVLPASEITLRNYLQTNEALQQLPAVDLISDNISVRGGTGYSFLGVGGSRVLMLIDDVPMLTSDFSRANWDFLPVTELERAEVLKGAASVLYGSGGVSGVVNLISRRPTLKPRLSFRASYGFYDDPAIDSWKWTDETRYFYRADLSYSQTLGPIGMRLSASRHLNTGYRQNSEVSRWYVTARPIINLGKGANLSLFFAYNREERDLFFLWKSQNRALETDFEDAATVDGYLGSMVLNKVFSPKYSVMLRASVNSQLLGLPLSLTEGFKPALGISGEFRNNWLIGKKHSLTFGTDYRHDIAESDFFGKHIANAYSPYLQDNWQVLPNVQLSAGLRYDMYFLSGDSAETQLNPKFGISYEPVPGTVFHSSIGRGFRTPSIAERFTEHDLQEAAQLLKNPELEPEKATLFDLGLRQRFSDHVSIEVAGFWSEYENLIELSQVSDLNLILQFRNCPHARIRGVESQVRVQLFNNQLNLLWNGTWMKSESLEDDPICKLDRGESLPYRPEFSTFFSPSLTVGPVTVESEYRYISRFDRVSFFLNEQRVAQEVLNLRARYHWKQFMLLFEVNNFTNHSHTVVEQNVGEIRNFSVSIAGEF